MSELVFACSFCQTRLSAGEEFVGENGSCPKCDRKMIIPPATGESVCSFCHQIIKYSGDFVGGGFACPFCKTEIKISSGVPTRSTAGGSVPTPRPPTMVPKAPPVAPQRSPLFGFFSKVGWCLLDCVTGEVRVIDKFPFDIGVNEAVDWRLDGILENHCSLISSKDSGVTLMKNDSRAAITINGYEADETSLLVADTDYAITLGPHCFLLRGSKGIENWLRQVDTRQWFVADVGTKHGPLKLQDVSGFVSQQMLDPQQITVSPRGVNVGFAFSQLAEAVRLVMEKAAAKAGEPDTTEVAPSEQRGPGMFTCPVCWLNFDIGDVMHITVHEDLRGDPVLGEDQMLRFLATKFNDKGQALDALGLPCVDMACPHCHRKLPSGFLETPHHIVSLVGAPSAGKSYYLSVLAKVLPRELLNQFGIVFQDADPTGNAALNVMKHRLFSGSTPEQVYLDKTALEGAMYEKILRQGRIVSLPKPFIFSVSPKDGNQHRCAIVFYDNAGEHFEPGLDDHRSPGAQHVATAACLFFLFDPASNQEFRRLLSEHHDPQLRLTQQLDQQEIILSEMKVRIQRHLHLRAGAKMECPLAVLVGKCDMWLHLLKDFQPSTPFHDGKLDLNIIAQTSTAVRGFLQGVCPEIVGNAETIANKVVYFPVSSLGHSPTKLADGRIAPNPKELHPKFVDVPMIWALSKIAPGLIPVVNGDSSS